MDHRKPHPELYNVPWTTDDYNGMPYRSLGKSGLRVSNVGLGTWKIGYPETGDDSRVDEKTALSIMDRALESGVTFWDTANRYNKASGNSERIIGTWFRNNPDQRRNIVLATKVFGGMDGRTPNHSRLSRGNILDSVYACLERLNVDHIDLLYFHSYDSITPPEESFTAVEDLVSKDIIRYFGVSNFTVEQIAVYQAVEKTAPVRCRILAVQNQFDIINGESSSHPGVLEYAAKTGISFIAWSPLARGLLTERYLDLSKVGRGDRLYDEGTLEKDTGKQVLKKLKRLSVLANKWDLTLNQLAIAYMLALPGTGPVIASVSTVQQLESNAAAGKIHLTDEQKALVKKIL
ncbi:MAG: aldo/keto reductase [Spirochaetes bacterium]|nr:aldo/keto reductase [Spirochaetota bacterium]